MNSLIIKKEILVKNIAYVFLLTVIQFHSYRSFCQQPQCSKDINSTFFVKMDLREYQIDSCLQSLLLTIVDADSNHIRFPPSLYYYDFTFANYGNYRQLMVVPMRWPLKIQSYYKGIFEIDKMYFLCSGDINTDSLFIYTGKHVRTKITSFDLYKYDSLDAKIKWFDWDHSPFAIIGVYRGCRGLPINMYVNVGKKIEDIETKYP